MAPETQLEVQPAIGIAEQLLVDEVAVREAPSWSRRLTRPWLLALAVAGAALCYVGFRPPGSFDGEPRWATLIVGAILLGFALNTLARRSFGPGYAPSRYLAAGWLILISLSAIFASLLPLAEARNASKTLHSPILARLDIFSHHPLGTDRQGLDTLGGVIFGFRVSLIVGVGSVLLGIIVGGLIGMVAGFYRHNVDRVVGVFTDATLAFPPLILLIALATALKPSVWTLTLELAVVTIPVYVRIGRAHALSISQREFVLAARAQGARSRRILLREIAPAVLRPLSAYGFVMVAVMIVAEASLSFLGLSIPPPSPTLGNMISSGTEDFKTHPHLVFVPATALFLTVLALNRLGEEAQRRFSHRETKL